MLVITRFLRRIVGDVEVPLSTLTSPFDLLSPAQEEQVPEMTSSPETISSPSEASSRSVSPAPPYESSPSPPSSPESRPPQVLSISILSIVKPSAEQFPAKPIKQTSVKQSLIRSICALELSKLYDTLEIRLISIESLISYQKEILGRLY